MSKLPPIYGFSMNPIEKYTKIEIDDEDDEVDYVKYIVGGILFIIFVIMLLLIPYYYANKKSR